MRVSYAAASLAAGYVPGSDADGGDPTFTGRTLALGDAPRDVDFAVRGTASLSDFVWADTNGNGVHDPGEAGIGGVTVRAVWHGPHGPVVLTVLVPGPGSIAAMAPYGTA